MKVLIALLLFLSITSPAMSEVAELAHGAVPTHTPFTFDFGQPLPDIQMVQVTFTGQGGHQCIHINRPGQNESINFPYDVPVDIEAGGAMFYAPLDQPYTTTLVLLLPEGDTWDSLADGTGTIEFSPYHTGPEIDNYQTTACGFDPCTVTSATIMVTYGDEVPVEPRSWSGLKAIFR